MLQFKKMRLLVLVISLFTVMSTHSAAQSRSLNFGAYGAYGAMLFGGVSLLMYADKMDRTNKLKRYVQVAAGICSVGAALGILSTAVKTTQQ